MEKITFKRSRLMAGLQMKENKRLFRWINLALITGGLSLIISFLYLILNLDQADVILIRLWPGLILGITFMALYAIGQRRLSKVRKQPKPKKSVSFRK